MFCHTWHTEKRSVQMSSALLDTRRTNLEIGQKTIMRFEKQDTKLMNQTIVTCFQWSFCSTGTLCVDLWKRRLLIYLHCRRILRGRCGGKHLGINLFKKECLSAYHWKFLSFGLCWPYFYKVAAAFRKSANKMSFAIPPLLLLPSGGLFQK